uniref:hypothetical protein n=1 Tax=Pappia fissilis TaxID=1040649 RepID=UPI002A80ACB7|nr:hypothetical protein UYP79_mgp035 [Pappia fissilis]WOX61301.1 hypothetical protein [Pappia fissilis]
MWAIFITAILLLLSLLVLALIFSFNCFILIVSFAFYLFILNDLENNRKIDLTIFQVIILFIVVFKITILVLTLMFNILSYFTLDLSLEPLYVLESNVNKDIKETHTTSISRSLVFTNDTWAGTIRSLFIYGSAGYAIHFSKAPGTGFKKVAIGAGAFLAETGGKIVENVINDPKYIKDHWDNWNVMWKKDVNGNILNDTLQIDVSKDAETASKVTNAIMKSSDSGSSSVSSFLPSFDNIFDPFSSLTDGLLRPIIEALKPQTVNYPIELLMDQHHALSIALFTLTIVSLFFFILSLYNIILILFKDKIFHFFKNKYILIYLNIQFKIIYVETILLTFLLLHNFYYLIVGLHFLAIFPIDININQ